MRAEATTIPEGKKEVTMTLLSDSSLSQNHMRLGIFPIRSLSTYETRAGEG